MLFNDVSGVEMVFIMIWWKLVFQVFNVQVIIFIMERIIKLGINVEKECDIEVGMLLGSLMI